MLMKQRRCRRMSDTEKRGPGRPATRTDASGELAHIHVKCAPKDKGAMVLAARDAGTNLSEWILRVALEAVPAEVWQRIEEQSR